MVEKAIWLDIALLCCIFTRLQLVKYGCTLVQQPAILPSQPSLYLLCYAIVSSDWLPHDYIGEVIVT